MQWLVAALVVLLIPGILVSWITGSEFEEHILASSLIGWSVIAAVIAVCCGFSKRCPHCGKWWAREEADRKALKQTGGFGTVIRHDIQRNRKGEKVGTIEREEQVYRAQGVDEVTYKCRYCTKTWSREVKWTSAS